MPQASCNERDTHSEGIVVGNRKQLFIDERFIAQSKGVSLTMNPPQKRGPVIFPDKPWETEHINFNSSVAQADDTYNMWYRCTSKKGHRVICYATSEDGYNWHKPHLGIKDFEGSKDNNIVMEDVLGTVVFFDPNGSEDTRYKAIADRYFPDPEKGGVYIHTSPDGIHWNISEDRVFPFIPDTANQAIWDSRLGKYVVYIRVWNDMRKIGRIETDNILEPWPYKASGKPYHIWGEDKIPVPSTEVPIAFGYDEQDPPDSDHYNPAAIKYPWAEDAYFMFPSTYLHTNGFQDIQMAVSRDGVTYHRPDRRPYIGLNPDGEKDSRRVFMFPGIMRNQDKLLHYYLGLEDEHGAAFMYDRDRVGAICCAEQRFDGFVSADAAYTGGELITPPIQFTGSTLFVNVNIAAMGFMQVGLTDEDFQEIPGYSVEECDMIDGNRIDHAVTWNGGSDVSSWAGTPVRLRFFMRAAKLYAFQFR